MPERSRKTPKDLNALASHIARVTTGDEKNITEPPAKNPAAVALGRLGGLKGGKARAESLSAEKRQEIARKAAKTRWAKNAD